MWLNNNFYAPDDAEFKTIKVAIINRDKIQLKIINQLLKTYKKCDIKRIEFLTEDEEEIITKPKTIKEKFKITLKCER
jgi:NACalpha-BTF3-like transcription factor